MPSDLSRLNEFVKYARNSAWDTIKKNPARVLYGAVDPASTWAWNKVLGRHDKPILNQLGSPQGGGDLGLNKNGGVYQDARHDGLSSGDVSQGQKFFGIGDTIAGFYGGSAAAGALGGGAEAGAGGGLGSGASVSPTGAGLLGTSAESTAAASGAGYSSAAGPTLAGEFVEPAASFGSTAAPAASATSSSAGLINQGQGLLAQPQQPQQQVQPNYPTQAQNPQQQQKARIALMQQMQLQQLRQKPNKTIEDYQMLQQADRGSGLLVGM